MDTLFLLLNSLSPFYSYYFTIFYVVFELLFKIYVTFSLFFDTFVYFFTFLCYSYHVKLNKKECLLWITTYI